MKEYLIIIHNNNYYYYVSIFSQEKFVSILKSIKAKSGVLK
jgi:hypothetical protein